MKDHQSLFSVDQMARMLEVSRSGYYNFLKRFPSLREQNDKKLLGKIKAIFEESYETYGSPRVHAELIDQGEKCSRRKVAKLMKENNLKAKMYKKFKKITISSLNPYYRGQDLVQQNFQAAAPNTIWVTDITYILCNKKWIYLAIIVDLFSRKVVGMALKETMKVDLICEALASALYHRKPPAGLIHHSDLGSQYTSFSLYKMAQKHNIRLSHGKTGCAYDNAAMESFFPTLKTEWTYSKSYQNIEEARLDIFTYVFTFYNRKRRHSTLNYHTPDLWEKVFMKKNFISVSTV